MAVYRKLVGRFAPTNFAQRLDNQLFKKYALPSFRRSTGPG
jgi:hypothetical protein